MPNINNQINPRLISIVPSFVIKRIVKNDAFVLFEVALFVADAHGGPFRPNQWQMNSQFLAGGSIMRSDVGSWYDCREKAMMIISRYQLLQNFDRFWHFCAIIHKRNIMQIQIKNIPLPFIGAEAAYFVVGYILISISWTPIRLKSFLPSKLQQLLPYYASILLQFGDPG